MWTVFNKSVVPSIFPTSKIYTYSHLRKLWWRPIFMNWRPNTRTNLEAQKIKLGISFLLQEQVSFIVPFQEVMILTI